MRDPFSGGLSRVQTPYSNLGGLKTSGIDLSLSWRAALEDLGMPVPGRISVGAQGTRVYHYVSQSTSTSAPLENVGYSNLPSWRTVTRLGYSTGQFSAGISWRYQPSVMPGVRQSTPDSPTLGGEAYSRFDGNAGYSIGALALRLSISNLLNTAPPAYGYNPWTTGVGTFLPSADLVGRRYTLTATMNF